MNKYSVVLISVLFFSTVRAESQTCTSVTTTTCDSGEIPPFSSPSPGQHHGNAVKRGKAGAKGEKGETGPAGPAGTDLSEVVAEVSAATARHGRQINRNSALLSELSGEISNVESEQNRRIEALASRQNATVERLILLVERQSEEILRLKERVEPFMNSCILPEVSFTTINSTRIVPHNTIVKYLCNLYYEAEGETVRSCVKGTILPSFQTNPLKCARKKLSFKEAQRHCKEHNMALAQAGIDTVANRRELCRRSGADSWTWIGMEKESTGGQWRLADGRNVPASFEFEWNGGRRGLPSINSGAGFDFMSVYCGSGQLYNYSNRPRNFICQDH